MVRDGVGKARAKAGGKTIDSYRKVKLRLALPLHWNLHPFLLLPALLA